MSPSFSQKYGEKIFFSFAAVAAYYSYVKMQELSQMVTDAAPVMKAAGQNWPRNSNGGGGGECR